MIADNEEFLGVIPGDVFADEEEGGDGDSEILLLVVRGEVCPVNV